MKEYIAEFSFDCAHCGDNQESGSAMFFHKRKKICGGCYESIQEGDGNERYNEDGFGSPEN